MPEEEVVIAPLLVARVDLRAESCQGILAGPVEMPGIFLEAVVGRQVHAAAEPPDRFLARLLGDEEAHVHVRGRAVGVARMEHQRDTHRLPAATRQFGAVRGGRGGHLLAHDVREIDPAALEHLAILDQAGDPAAALRSVPSVPQER